MLQIKIRAINNFRNDCPFYVHFKDTIFELHFILFAIWIIDYEYKRI